MVKLVINDVKTGKAYQTEEEVNPFTGVRLGKKVDGSAFGLKGYELQITGASDQCGFPLRCDLKATTRKKPLFVQGVGLRINARNDRQRKTVCPNDIKENTSQVNLKVLTYGDKKLEDVYGKKEDKSEGDEQPKAEEKPKEEVTAKPAEKEAPRAEEKKEAPKEEGKPEEKKDK
ncbi:30S ribosomal protein S6e [archaeon]|nr:30S ribosomal protein S6e [archaeon]